MLSHIKSPKDVKKLAVSQLTKLAAEIRRAIIQIVASKSGHLGAGLGVVELTVALHYHYDFLIDKLIWDVGHQCYPHKMLTGRYKEFEKLRQQDGISGFPLRTESIYDHFGTGHSSTSIAAITGMAFANNLTGSHGKHIAVIGDASITSGMAFEALNYLGATNLDVLVILNDNGIGIDPNVGALCKYLEGMTAPDSLANFFELLGFAYQGVVDGHDITALLGSFTSLDEQKGPKVLHLKTIKGKGFHFAEKEQVTWHSPGKFNILTGEREETKRKKYFQDIFGLTLCALAKENKKIVGITPAMPSGSGLNYMMEQFPERAVDVGIAEQYAITMAAGMAAQGLVPYVTIYSTFLQRAYDQLIHDVALQGLPIVLCVDRAGNVGQDGATHHGVFDIAYIRAIPHMILAAPIDEIELQQLLYTAQFTQQPFAIRYPKGEVFHTDDEATLMWKRINIGKAVKLKAKGKLAVLSTGTVGHWIRQVEVDFTYVHFPFIKPLDIEMLCTLFATHNRIITYEEGVISGGFGESILAVAQQQHYKGEIILRGFPDDFLSHGTVKDINRQIEFDIESITSFIKKYI